MRSLLPAVVLLLLSASSADDAWMKRLTRQLIATTETCSRNTYEPVATRLQINRDQFARLDAYGSFFTKSGIASDPRLKALFIAKIDVSIICIYMLAGREPPDHGQRAQESIGSACTILDIPCGGPYGREETPAERAERYQDEQQVADATKIKIEGEKKEAAELARKYRAEHQPEEERARMAAILQRDEERAAGARVAMAAYSAYSLCSAAEPIYGSQLPTEKAVALGKRFVAAFDQEKATATRLSQTTSDPQIREVLSAAETIYQFCRELAVSRSLSKDWKSRANAARAVLGSYRP